MKKKEKNKQLCERCGNSIHPDALIEDPERENCRHCEYDLGVESGEIEHDG